MKKLVVKKKTALSKTAPTTTHADSPAGPDPKVQIECKAAEVRALQIDKDRLQAEILILQAQLKEQHNWHEAMLRDITRQHKMREK
ncbi:hypothetical protein VYU27_000173 [Nannochloropsis oceanica]